MVDNEDRRSGIQTSNYNYKTPPMMHLLDDWRWELFKLQTTIIKHHQWCICWIIGDENFFNAGSKLLKTLNSAFSMR